MRLGRSEPVLAAVASSDVPVRAALGDDPVRSVTRGALRAWLDLDIVPGLQQLADPARDPADLRALAAAQGTRLRMELEGDSVSAGLADARDPACGAEDEREWIRGHLHDTALQILEFIAGDGFGTGLSSEKIAHLAGGAARDLRRWMDADPLSAQLVPELERITADARTLGSGVKLVVGELEREPTGRQVSALTGAVREAVTNARKHAHASQVTVRVTADEDGRTTVTVTDDGVGLDPELVGDAGGLGLPRSIFGRMRHAGGEAALDAAPGGGTRVTLATSPELEARP